MLVRFCCWIRALHFFSRNYSFEKILFDIRVFALDMGLSARRVTAYCLSPGMTRDGLFKLSPAGLEPGLTLNQLMKYYFDNPSF